MYNKSKTCVRLCLSF